VNAETIVPGNSVSREMQQQPGLVAVVVGVTVHLVQPATVVTVAAH